MPLGARAPPLYRNNYLFCTKQGGKAETVKLNLNAVANTHVASVGFNLFKFENLPAIVDVDGAEGEACYERGLRAYNAYKLAVTRSNFELSPSKDSQWATDNVVYSKFFTDATIGTRREQDPVIEPGMSRQYIRYAPSIDADDYQGAAATATDGDGSSGQRGYATALGFVSIRTVAQLSPIIVNWQSYVLKMFATRVASKVGITFAFIMLRIILPFFFRTKNSDEDGGRIFGEPLSCRPGEADLDQGCMNVLFLSHTRRQFLFTLFLIFCDTVETRETMLAWRGFEKQGGVLVPHKSHLQWLQRYMGRYGYKALFLHFAMRSTDVTRGIFNVAFGRLNENYCAGEDREAHLCYKYNRTH